MLLGIIGLGMVGEAIKNGLEKYNHKIIIYDIKFQNTKIEDILKTDLVFICVPTPPNSKNECDITIVENTIDKLNKLNYTGMIVIKSTIPPGTTDFLINKYKNLKISFCPEFLKERCATDDFIYNNNICIIGTYDDDIYNLVKNIHKNICKIFKKTSPIEAELTKYFQNVYNTCRIIFANGFYEVCKYNNVNYNSIIESLLKRNEIDDKYLRCSEDLRGPDGPCLMKDTLAFNEYIKTLKLKNIPKIFNTLIDDAKLYPKTVIKGTRNEKEYFGKEL